MPVERKSVEPMAAITAPGRTAALHQSLLHFVGQGAWSDAAVLGKVREMVVPQIERHGPIEAWIIDDTSFPKKGEHSVGAANQYCGQLGKQANCQVAVSLSVADHAASLPWLIGRTCRKTGLRTKAVGTKRERRRDQLQYETGDRSRSHPLGGPDRPSWRLGRVGCGLRQRRQAAHGHHGDGEG